MKFLFPKLLGRIRLGQVDDLLVSVGASVTPLATRDFAIFVHGHGAQPAAKFFMLVVAKIFNFLDEEDEYLLHDHVSGRQVQAGSLEPKIKNGRVQLHEPFPRVVPAFLIAGLGELFQDADGRVGGHWEIVWPFAEVWRGNGMLIRRADATPLLGVGYGSKNQ